MWPARGDVAGPWRCGRPGCAVATRPAAVLIGRAIDGSE
jgi:hypothetical protein